MKIFKSFKLYCDILQKQQATVILDKDITKESLLVLIYDEMDNLEDIYVDSIRKNLSNIVIVRDEGVSDKKRKITCKLYDDGEKKIGIVKLKGRIDNDYIYINSARLFIP